ncbi:acyltransferase [Arthrobacter bambusae]|uniref:acyltransferase n=1 Tax=Arthrobacter bambusae TaxID=1338426 RepID=UPI002781E5DD|nr:acetyltransferase-like isoleucine patch superfamily enzyme [Arthrobacter bambusae]
MRGRLRRLISRLYILEVRRRGIVVGENCYLSGRPITSRVPGSTIEIGSNFVAESVARRQVIGVAHPAIFRTVASGARLVIGDDCGVSGATIVAAVEIVIGPGALLGADCMIIDTNFHPIAHQKRRYAQPPQGQSEDAVHIGANVFIGARALVLPGASIGDNCVVAAGSVVAGTFPAGSLIAGVPARLVKRLDFTVV